MKRYFTVKTAFILIWPFAEFSTELNMV